MIKEYDKNGRFFLKYIGEYAGYIGAVNYKGDILIPMSASNMETCKYYPLDSKNRVDTNATPHIFKSRDMKQFELHQPEGEQYYHRSRN